MTQKAFIQNDKGAEFKLNLAYLIFNDCLTVEKWGIWSNGITSQIQEDQVPTPHASFVIEGFDLNKEGLRQKLSTTAS